jgi:hypothetical protein
MIAQFTAWWSWLVAKFTAWGSQLHTGATVVVAARGPWLLAGVAAVALLVFAWWLWWRLLQAKWIREREQRIRERAYFLSQQSGFPIGRDLDFWIQASRLEPNWSWPGRTTFQWRNLPKEPPTSKSVTNLLDANLLDKETISRLSDSVTAALKLGVPAAYALGFYVISVYLINSGVPLLISDFSTTLWFISLAVLIAAVAFLLIAT